jgi:tetratricopeptide (TPR) repeat protein
MLTCPRSGSVSGLRLGAAFVALAASYAVGGSPGLEEARSQFAFRHHREAIALLQASLTQALNDGQAHYWLARCFYELRDYNNSVAHAESAVGADPRNSEYHLWLGRAYGRKAEQTHSFILARRTKSEFEESIRLKNSNIPARRDLAEFHLQAPWIVGGRKDEALSQIEAIAALDPVQGHIARANYWLHENQLDQAEAEMEQILTLKPGRIDPYFEVADFYEDHDKLARMDAAVEAAARIDGADSRLACYRGRLLVMEGKRLGEAEAQLKACLISPRREGDLSGDVTALVWLGRLYERLNKLEEATARYRAALQLDSGCQAARDAMGRIEKNR